MKSKKIMLISCASRIPKGAFARSYPPLGIAYLAACLENKGYEVHLYDPLIEGFDNLIELPDGMMRNGDGLEKIRARINSVQPNVIGISTLFAGDAIEAHDMLKAAREICPNAVTALGGHYPFTMPERALNDENLDYLIMGEGEESFTALIDYLNGVGDFPKHCYTRENRQTIVTGDFPAVKDITKLPIPARHLLPMDKYFQFMAEREMYKPLQNPSTTLMATRGCPLACTFCMHTAMNGADYEKRQVDNVRAEVEHLVATYGVREINFVDENLTLYKKFTMSLTDMLKEMKLSWYMMAGTYVNSLTPEILVRLRESGCYRLKFNVESANPETLEIMRKPVNLNRALELIALAKKLGFVVQGQFVIGYPNETIESIHRQTDWINKADFDYVTFCVATPYPGTTLYKQVKAAGFLTTDSEEDHFSMHLGAGKISTPNFRPEDIAGLRRELWQSLNFCSDEKKRRAARVFDPAVEIKNIDFANLPIGDDA